MNLYTFNIEYGREGYLHGMFIADKSRVEEAIGKQLYFGEALGKHSCVNFELERGDIELVPVRQEAVQDLFVIYANDTSDTSVTIIGYNPLDYIYEEENE